MSLRIPLVRFAPLLGGALVLLYAAHGMFGNPRALLDPRALAVTLLLPWLVLALTDSWSSAAAAWRDLALANPAELPRARRAVSALRLEALGSTSVAAGVVAALTTFVANVNVLATRSGQVDANAWVGLSAGLLLGPIYGLLTKALLYDPAATSLRAASTASRGPGRPVTV